MIKFISYKKSNASLLGILFFICFSACKKAEKVKFSNQIKDYSIDTSQIPNDTISHQETNVTLKNGLYLLDDALYSGIVYNVQKGFQVETYSSVLNGKLHGTYRSYYTSGEPFEIRLFRNNLSIGQQLGYWEETGTLKFEYNYYNDKREGVQRSWFTNGKPAYVYNYKDDKQDGLQQAWRFNGSLYRNFEVKKGVRYGLQKTVSCKELIDEKFKKKS